jgi:hypothetical protein
MTRTHFVIALVLFSLPAFAQHGKSSKPADDSSATPAAAKSAEPKSAEAKSADAKSSDAKSAEPMKNPLPADKSVPQTITVNGKTLHYTATVGTITLKNRDDKATGVVMYTAYTLDSPRNDEPRGKSRDSAMRESTTRESTMKDGDGGSHRRSPSRLMAGPGHRLSI